MDFLKKSILTNFSSFKILVSKYFPISCNFMPRTLDKRSGCQNKTSKTSDLILYFNFFHWGTIIGENLKYYHIPFPIVTVYLFFVGIIVIGETRQRERNLKCTASMISCLFFQDISFLLSYKLLKILGFVTIRPLKVGKLR